MQNTGHQGLSTGEYPIQTGFGYSNGIILELLQRYKSNASIENWKITAANCYEALTSLTVSNIKLRNNVLINVNITIVYNIKSIINLITLTQTTIQRKF